MGNSTSEDAQRARSSEVCRHESVTSMERVGAAAEWRSSVYDRVPFKERRETRYRSKSLVARPRALLQVPEGSNSQETERGYTERYEVQGAVCGNRQGIAIARVLSGTEESKRKKGSSSLRSSADVSISENKPDNELSKHAKILYDWVSIEKPSRIRMLMNWQAAGGLSFVSSVHHLCACCFSHLGNSMNDDTNEKKVTCEEFQNAIISRHRVGDSGMNDEKWTASQISADCS